MSVTVIDMVVAVIVMVVTVTDMVVTYTDMVAPLVSQQGPQCRRVGGVFVCLFMVGWLSQVTPSAVEATDARAKAWEEVHASKKGCHMHFEVFLWLR